MNQEFDDIPADVLNDDETLMKYLRGELAAEEEAVFMKKLQDNPDLKQRAVAVARLIKGLERKGIENNEEFTTAFKKLSADDVKNISKPSGKVISLKKVLVWVSSAAAVLVLVIGLRIFYVNNYNESLVVEYEKTFQLSEFSRGGEEDVNNELQLLFDNVLKGKDLNSTIEKLSAIFEESQSEYFNKYRNALDVSGWYLALAHLKNHDGDQAKKVLSKLSMATEKDGTRQKADELMAKIK